ncbi:tetratricopeptide repeat protein [candidate division KSB1 bacterium]
MTPVEHLLRISLCMIVKNEEGVLGACLESVRGLVDEMIIVDTGSDDNTVEIAKSYNADVFTFTWADDFSAARNYSIQQASGDWILILDADETLPAEDAQKIRDIAESGEGIAYYLNFRSTVQETSAGKELVHSHARLFRNGLGICFSGRIHEQIIESVVNAGGEIGPTNIYVNHSGYAIDEREKIERNIHILKKEHADNPENGIPCFYLGESYSQIRDWHSAVEYYKKALEHTALPRFNRALALQNLGTAYYNLCDYDNSLLCELNSLRDYPGRITPHVVRAEAAMAIENFDLAVWEWQSVLDFIREEDEEQFTRLSDFVPDAGFVLLRLAESFFLSKDYEQARVKCRELLQKDPENQAARLLLIKAMFLMRDFDYAYHETQRILNDDPDQPDALLLMGKIEGNRGNYAEALDFFKKAVGSNPNDTEARKDLERVRQIMRDKKDIAPDEDTILDRSEVEQRKQDVIALFKSGQIALALEILDPLLRNSDDYELYFLKAYAEDNLKNYDNVIMYAHEALQRHTGDPRIDYLLGRAYMKKDDIPNAVQHFEQAAKSEPKMFEAWSALGVAFIRGDDLKKAKEAFEQAHKLQPDDLQIKKNLAAICAKLGLKREAEHYLLLTKM